MAGSHLVIGLGGTGGRIIRALQKTLATVSKERLAGSHFDFLYVDSDAAAMNPDDPTWRVLGRSVALNANQKLRIGGMDTAAILANLDQYPNLRSWIGNVQQMRSYLQENINVAAGGQRRRYGRLLFAQAARDFRAAAVGLKRRLQSASGQANITVHICAGLAGGTGSGAVVDAVAQIRQHVANNAVVTSNYFGDAVQDDRVLLYLVLPEEIPPGGWDSSGFYHANGYAALMELNALLVGTYHPADVAEAGQPMLTLPRPAFNGAYLVTNRNMAGHIIEPEHAVPQLIADFIFQKSVTSQTEEVLRAENAENGNAADEPSVADGGDPMPERSKRFLAFGVQRVVVPDEEVHEYFTYHFAFRAGRQFLFNNWTNGVGFVDEARQENFNPMLRDPARLGGWLLSDEHLTLARPILLGDGRDAQGRVIWQAHPILWDTAKSAAVQAAMEGGGRPDEWLAKIRDTLNRIYGDGFRRTGVATFYEQNKQAVGKMADQIRLIVERELFAQWKTGQYGLVDLRNLLEALVTYLRKKREDAETTAAKKTELANEQRRALDAAVSTFNKTGTIAAMFGKRRTLFLEAAEHLAADYSFRTEAAGWQFAYVLLPEVIARVNDLYDEIGQASARVQAAVAEFERQYNSRLRVRSSAGGGTGGDGTFEHRQRLFDMDQIARIRDGFLADQQLQESVAQAFRDALSARLGAEGSFTKFLTTLDGGTLQTALEALADERTTQATMQLSPAQQRALVANIVAKLAQQLGGNNEAVARWVRDRASGAAPFCSFDSAQVAAVGPGTVMPHQPPRETCVVVIPEAPGAADFGAGLEREFKGSVPPTTVVRLTHDGAPENEIAVYQLRNLFPVRWVGHTRFLRGRYEQTCATNPAAQYFVHSAGGESDYPPLFVMAPTEVVGKNLHYLLLAFALGLVTEKKDAATGQASLVCGYVDAVGFPQELPVAGSVKEALEAIPLPTMLTLRSMVDKTVGESRFEEAAARRQTFEAMVRLVSEYMTSALRGDRNHPQYRLLQDMAVRAKREILHLTD